MDGYLYRRLFVGLVLLLLLAGTITLGVGLVVTKLAPLVQGAIHGKR
jgi:hypothetical protein